MNEVRDALLRMVRSGLEVKSLQETYLKVGLDDGPLFGVFGDICDAIYYLIGEHKEQFTDSLTYLVMNAPILSEERRVEMLMAEYRKNFPEQPGPSLMSSDGMKELYERNGGYMTPEGDWT